MALTSPTFRRRRRTTTIDIAGTDTGGDGGGRAETCLRYRTPSTGLVGGSSWMVQ